MKQKLVAILLFTVLSGFSTRGQKLSPHAVFSHLSMQQGLSGNSVTCMIQDKYGFIWIGTTDGLNRFDGNTFLTFRNTWNDSTSLPFNEVTALALDKKGRMWVATAKGFALFDYGKRGFINFISSPQNLLYGNADSYITSMVADDENGLWFGTKQWLHHFNIRTGKFTYYIIPGNTIKPVYEDSRTVDLCRDSKGNLWVATLNGVKYFDVKQKRFVPEKIFISPDLSFARLCIYNNKLWVASKHHGLHTLDLTTFEISHIRLCTNETQGTINCFLHLPDKLLIGTSYAGIFEIDTDNKVTILWKQDYGNTLSLSDNGVNCLFNDKDNTLWVGTMNSGVDRTHTDGGRFNRWQFSENWNKGERALEISGIDACGKNLLLASNIGILVLDSQYRIVKKISGKNGLSSTNVQVVSSLNQQQFLAGTDNGLNLVDVNTGGVKKYRHLPVRENRSFFPSYDTGNHSFMAGNEVFSVFRLRDGRFLIGTSSGINRLDVRNNYFENVYNTEAIKKHLTFIESILEDKKGNYWFNNGWVVEERSKGLRLLHEYAFNPEDSTSISSNMINCMIQDSDEKIWFATESGGVCCMNYQTRKSRRYGLTEGLPSLHVRALQTDDEGRIWVSTINGIACYDERFQRFIAFTEQDGLNTNSFTHATFKDHNGTIYFGGRNGFTRFNPNDIRANFIAPSVYLSAFSVFNRQLNFEKGIENVKKIVLNYGQRFFSFSVSVLNYKQPGRNRYAHFLEGFDEGWNYKRPEQEAIYTNVPPGKYQLKIKGSNNNGVWGSQPLIVEVIIIPPFWQRWWFLSLIAVSLLCTGFALYKNRLNKIRAREAAKTEFNRKISEVKMAALRAQMNPHFIFNALSSIQHYISENKSEEAIMFLTKFSRLIRFILQNAARNTISLTDEIIMLRLYLELEKMRFGKQFDFHINVDNKLQHSHYEIPAMLIQPFVENALVHGLLNKSEGGKLEISFTKTGQNICCVVKDDGVGRKKAAEIKAKKQFAYMPISTGLIMERLETMNNLTNGKTEIKIVDLFDEKDNPAGTRVEISISLEDI